MMKLQGIPAWFWIVVRPLPHSKIEDICFRSNFHQFSMTFRAGVDENLIFGIYADEAMALADAEQLLATRHGDS